jgi:hypothetical protein
MSPTVWILAVNSCIASGLVLTLGIARQSDPGWPKRFTFLPGIFDRLIGVGLLPFVGSF